jgi:hypothetical protein
MVPPKYDEIAPEEAKRILVEQARRTRERQREFNARMKAEGRRRVSAYMTGEAAAALDRMKAERGLNAGDMLSSIVLWYAEHNQSVSANEVTPKRGGEKADSCAVAPTPATPKKARKRSGSGGRSAAAQARIVDLLAEGQSLSEIAEALAREGVEKPRGGTDWTKSGVNQMIRSGGLRERAEEIKERGRAMQT